MARTHIPQRRIRQPPAALTRTGASGPGAAAEAPTPRELAQSRGPPSLSARREARSGRCCPLSALPQLPAAHATPTARRARPRPPGAARRLGSARDARSVAPARRALSPCSFRQAARSGRAGRPQAGGGWGRRSARPTAPAPPAGPLRRVGPGRERRRRAPWKRRRAWRFPGQPPGESARGGGGAGRVRVGAVSGRACGLRSPRRRLGMSQPGREGPGAPELIG